MGTTEQLSHYTLHYMEFRKKLLMNLFAEKQCRQRHREQNYGHEVGEEGEAGMYGESNMEA